MSQRPSQLDACARHKLVGVGGRDFKQSIVRDGVSGFRNLLPIAADVHADTPICDKALSVAAGFSETLCDEDVIDAWHINVF